MHATVRSYSGASELADALIANESGVKGVISGVPGLRAYYMIRTADGAMTVTVCDDQAGAEESTRMAAEWIRENLPGVSAPAPQVSTGEVAITV